MKRKNLISFLLGLVTLICISLPAWAAGPIKMDLVSRLESPPQDVAVQGDYAYTVGRGSFTIYNVQNPAKPVKTGACRLPNFGTSVSVKGNYAAVACLTSGFMLIDIRDPNSPQVAGQFKETVRTVDADYDGKLSCLAEEVDGMRLLDASSPGQLRILSHYTEDTISKVLLKGSYAYGIGVKGLHIWDISNPRQPQQLSVISSVNFLWEALEVDGSYLYTGAGLLYVYDISNPSQPVCISSTFRLPNCISVKKQGSILHWAGYSKYALVSVEDPRYPQQLAVSSTNIKYAHRVAFNENASFIADLYSGLKCYAYSSTSLTLLSEITAQPEVTVAAFHQPFLFVLDTTSTLSCYDLTSSHEPRITSQLRTPGVKSIEFHNQYLYAISVDSVSIISVSESGELKIVNTLSYETEGLNSWSHCSVQFCGNYLYVPYANNSIGNVRYLQIYDITTPEQAYLASTTTIDIGDGYWISSEIFIAQDSKLYLFANNYLIDHAYYYLFAYDVSNPLNPTLIKPLLTYYYLRIKEARGDYLFSNNWRDFIIYKTLYDLNTTEIVSTFTPRLPCRDYKIIGNIAVMLLETGEVFLLDVRDPEHIKNLGGYMTGSYDTKAVAGDGNGNTFCTLEGQGGLSIFQISTQLPAMKLKTGEGLSPAYNLSDYYLADSSAGYYIDKNALGLAQLNGDTVSQLSYSQPTVNYHQFAMTLDNATSYAVGAFKYSSYKLSKLPEVVLSEGKTAKLDISGYLDKDESSEWPKSFGNQESLLVSDTASIQAHWDNSSTILITCLKSFESPEWVDVIASPQSEGPYANAADQDRERIWIYPNAIPQGDFSSDSDTTLFALEPLEVGDSTVPMEYFISMKDASGDTGKGVLAFSFSSTVSKVKGTLQFNSHIQYAANQWYRARMRVYSPEAGNAIEASLFNFNGIACSTAEHVDVAGEIFFGVPTTWTWMDVPLYTHAADSGYAQFVLKGNGEGKIYIDEIQLFKADPPIVNTRSLNTVAFPQGDFDEAADIDKWSFEDVLVNSTTISVSNGQLEILTRDEFKMTALNDEGNIYTPGTPVNKWAGMKMTLSTSSIFRGYSKDYLIIMGLYGIQNQGQYEMGVPESELFASAEFGRVQGGEYWVAGKAINPYHQVQMVLRNRGNSMFISEINFKIDSDDPDYGDPELYPLHW